MKRALLFALIFTASTALAADRHRAVDVQLAHAVLTSTAANGNIDAVVAIDLRNVFVGEHQPAILAGYVAAITYDPQKVAFVSATASDNPQFNEAPFATDPAIANANGIVKFAAAQTDPHAPDGLVRVAHLVFRELVPGGADSMHARVLSAATAVEGK